MVSQSAEQRLKILPATQRWSRVPSGRLVLTCCLFTAACGSGATTVTTTEVLTSSGNVVTTTRTSTEKTLLDVILTAGSGHLEVKTNPGATCMARAVDGSGNTLKKLDEERAGPDGRVVWNIDPVITPAPTPSESSSNSTESSSNNNGTFIVNCTEPGFLPAPTTTMTFNLG